MQTRARTHVQRSHAYLALSKLEPAHFMLNWTCCLLAQLIVCSTKFYIEEGDQRNSNKEVICVFSIQKLNGPACSLKMRNNKYLIL